MEPVLKQHYKEKVVPELKNSQGYKNVHDIPRIEKVVINSGFDAAIDKSGIEETVRELSKIAGQKPIITKARKSIANFKLREGMPIGVKVTLRGNSMYEFLYRMLAIALPGIRDFRGVPQKLDGKGNYTLGITDHTIFAEAAHENKRTIGMDITIVTSAKTDEEGHELIKLMGMPFRKKNQN
jgi:large subunit ribosomal protein L5